MQIATLARLALLAAIAALALGACAKKQSIVENAPYSGPPITVISTGPRHTVVVAAPSGGYRVQFDRKEKRFDATDVYMTVSRPDPAQMHTQAVVDLHLDTTVSSSEPIVLFARVRDFGTSGTSDPYRRALEAVKQPAP
jgi:hypothetical protein